MVSALAAAAEAPRRDAAPRRVTILGATGSVGTSALSVIAERAGSFAVEAVTANANADKLARVARAANARLAVVADPAAYADLKAALSGSGIAAAAGSEAVREAAERPVDLVVGAIVGAAGIAPTYAAIRAGRRVAIANKECLVSAGSVFMQAAAEEGIAILPMDSEHNAIYQALAGRPIEEVERIVITASGGPFRTWSAERMATAKPADALKHPNWSMGPKITVDSATMMNKGLEVIEAHHLFAAPTEKLDVLVHPQSVVHGMVAFHDGAVMAGLGVPDMRMPIAHCLSWPEASPLGGRRLDLAELGSLTFERPDIDRFPALRLAREALDAGAWATNILNAANEVAVGAFLTGRIGFLEIAGLVGETIEKVSAETTPAAPESVEEAIALDQEGRNIAGELVRARRSR